MLVVGPPWGAAVAEASYRHLGHALAPDPAAPTHLVVGHAQAARVRTVLETDGIIGWVVTESWFQRRLGLVDLVATTAAGAEKVVVHDVPRERAVRARRHRDAGRADRLDRLSARRVRTHERPSCSGQEGRSRVVVDQAP